MGLTSVILSLMVSLSTPLCAAHQSIIVDAPAEAETCCSWGSASAKRITIDADTIAYQRARHFELDGRLDDAIQILKGALDNGSDQDPAVADLFVELVFRLPAYSYFDYGAAVYMRLLEHIDADHVPLDVRRRILGELLPVLTPPVHVATALTPQHIYADSLPRGVGRQLVAFWRESDPLPASIRNERLVEHLTRVAYVRERLVTENGTVDDRAATYIRYGEPLRRTAIKPESGSVFSSQRIYQRQDKTGVVPELRVPENEMWVYSRIDAGMHFLFFRDEDTHEYRLGGASDLLPNSWAMSPRRVSDFLYLAETLYEQLSVNHSDYGMIYTDVANFNMLRRSGQVGILPQSPRSFASSVLSESRSLDYYIEQNLRENAPPIYSNVRENTEQIPIDLRVARFLTQEGATRIEAYWGTDVAALRPDKMTRRGLRDWGLDPADPDLHYLMALTGTAYNENHEPLERNDRHYRLGPFDTSEGLLSPSPVILVEIDEPTRLALQWDLHVHEIGGTVGPLIKYYTDEVYELRPLEAGRNQFEMSDIRPMIWTDPQITDDFNNNTQVYPFRKLGSHARLVLYFEVYNVTTSETGEHWYTVEYLVSRGSGSRSRDASVKSSYLSPLSTDKNFIVVEMADWKLRGDVSIILEVTDEVSGRSVSRSIDFEVVGLDSSD